MAGTSGLGHDEVENLHESLLCARFKGQTGLFAFLLDDAGTPFEGTAGPDKRQKLLLALRDVSDEDLRGVWGIPLGTRRWLLSGSGGHARPSQGGQAWHPQIEAFLGQQMTTCQEALTLSDEQMMQRNWPLGVRRHVVHLATLQRNAAFSANNYSQNTNRAIQTLPDLPNNLTHLLPRLPLGVRQHLLHLPLGVRQHLLHTLAAPARLQDAIDKQRENQSEDTEERNKQLEVARAESAGSQSELTVLYRDFEKQKELHVELREQLKKYKKTLDTEHAKHKSENEAWDAERAAWDAERAAWDKERAAWDKERASLAKDAREDARKKDMEVDKLLSCLISLMENDIPQLQEKLRKAEDNLRKSEEQEASLQAQLQERDQKHKVFRTRACAFANSRSTAAAARVVRILLLAWQSTGARAKALEADAAREGLCACSYLHFTAWQRAVNSSKLSHLQEVLTRILTYADVC